MFDDPSCQESKKQKEGTIKIEYTFAVNNLNRKIIILICLSGAVIKILNSKYQGRKLTGTITMNKFIENAQII